MAEQAGASHFVVIGAAGMLGRAWVQLLDKRGLPYVALTRQQLDLLQPQSVEDAVVAGTRVVVNCAAWTDVDGAEAEEEKATQLNAHAVGVLAARCRQVGATLVHYGTDYVFDGEGREPYAVDHAVAPLNAYGRGKALGEKLLAESGADYLLIRTSWVYAPWGKNFVRTMARLAAERSVLKVVSDQVGRPTSAEGLASQSLALLEAKARGTYHVTDSGKCSWYEFAAEVVEACAENGLLPEGHGCRVEPCTSEQFPTPAKRPASSVLSLKKTQDAIGEAKDWHKAVREVVARLT